jgi:predicted dehydrogenase
VGFQSLGSAALAAVAEVVAAGRIGEVSHIGVAGTWVRATSYFRRAPWAGKRMLDGRPVVDGVTTNPLAHATATALRLAGARLVDDVIGIDLELYRANDIEADDTSSLVLRSTTGPTIAAALTLCAPVNTDPWVAVYGSAATPRAIFEGRAGAPSNAVVGFRDQLEESTSQARAARSPGNTPVAAPVTVTAPAVAPVDTVPVTAIAPAETAPTQGFQPVAEGEIRTETLDDGKP